MLIGRIPSPVISQVWKTKATPKCRIRAWLLLHSKCLTADNLAKRGWPHNPICKLCHIHPETTAHLPVACSYSRQEALGKLSLPARFVPTSSCIQLKAWWQSCSFMAPAKIFERWQTVPLLTWWQIWKERNDRIFNKASTAAIVDKIITELTIISNKKNSWALVAHPFQLDHRSGSTSHHANSISLKFWSKSIKEPFTIDGTSPCSSFGEGIPLP